MGDVFLRAAAREREPDRGVDAAFRAEPDRDAQLHEPPLTLGQRPCFVEAAPQLLERLVDARVRVYTNFMACLLNAGIGILGAFEATPMVTAREVVVVNVTSSATLTPMPLVAAYTASKMAIEGFTASLAFELEAFDVRVKLVEPGYCPTTRFTSNGTPRMEGLIPQAYAPFAQRVFAAFTQPAAVTTESDVAEAVYRAANDESGQLRFPAGPDAVALAKSR
jgi:NAD(P)-dependent dehydrogenase (short-subunit alcohol dehydrogenase family)